MKEVQNQHLQSAVKNLHKKRLPNEDCKGVLGDTAKVNAFAIFWGSHGQDLQTVVARQMLDFCEKNSFSDSEFRAFKAGVSSLPVFFAQCFKEVEMRKQAIEASKSNEI